jgi:hypothetical protein
VYDTSAYETSDCDATLHTGVGTGDSVCVSGRWSSHSHGQDGQDDESPIIGLTEIVFGECVGPDNTFEGTAENSRHGTAEITSGRVSVRDGLEVSDITFTWTFTSSEDVYVFHGTLDPSTKSIIEGQWGPDQDSLEHEFRFSRAPAFAHRFRCNPVDCTQNPARARWMYACKAILYSIQRRRWSWEFVRERLAERRKHVQLYIHNQQFIGEQSPSEEWTADQEAELTTLEDSLVEADRRLYRSIAEVERRKVTVHKCAYSFTAAFLSDYMLLPSVVCDTCGKFPLGYRVMCLTCSLPNQSDQINLCIQCIDTTPWVKTFEHSQSHPVVKLSSTLLSLQKSWIISTANYALDDVDDTEPKTCSSCEKLVPESYWLCLLCCEMHLCSTLVPS